jgi:hypothetical protein
VVAPISSRRGPRRSAGTLCSLTSPALAPVAADVAMASYR